jgi:hypothetical protein
LAEPSRRPFPGRVSLELAALQDLQKLLLSCEEESECTERKSDLADGSAVAGAGCGLPIPLAQGLDWSDEGCGCREMSDGSKARDLLQLTILRVEITVWSVVKT